MALLGGRVLLASTDLGEIRRQLEGRSDVRDVLVERIRFAAANDDDEPWLWFGGDT